MRYTRQLLLEKVYKLGSMRLRRGGGDTNSQQGATGGQKLPGWLKMGHSHIFNKVSQKYGHYFYESNTKHFYRNLPILLHLMVNSNMCL